MHTCGQLKTQMLRYVHQLTTHAKEWLMTHGAARLWQKIAMLCAVLRCDTRTNYQKVSSNAMRARLLLPTPLQKYLVRLCLARCCTISRGVVHKALRPHVTYLSASYSAVVFCFQPLFRLMYSLSLSLLCRLTGSGSCPKPAAQACVDDHSG